MLTQPFETVSVLGSGTMGAGIAQVLAGGGISVTLYDLNEGLLKSALERTRQFLSDSVQRGKLDEAAKEQTLSRIRTTTDLSEAARAQLVIEAVPENMALKKELFQQLDALATPETILASNTSSLSISALAGATQRPDKVAGLHFFNPVALMKLVEVIQGHQTCPQVIARLRDLVTFIGKTPVTCKDTPGFIVNRVARPFYGEAFRLLAEGVAGDFDETVKTVDDVLRAAGGFKMGPFELMDLIGLDVNFAVTSAVYEATFHEPRYRPHPIQERMVSSGLLGRKTKAGFYHYE